MHRSVARLLLLSTTLLTEGGQSFSIAHAAAANFDIPQSGLTILTGDSWRIGEQVFRLYGVQSCLRGTAYTDRAGKQQDCGAVSAAVLAAILRDTKPRCSPVAQISRPSSTPLTIIVVCAAHVGSETLDLGSIIITQGFGFAAMNGHGRPVYAPYLAQEMLAQQARAGLWAFPDVPQPNLDAAQ
ncbi:succinoglycan biosynthesis protein exoi [Xaviernesmea oryzae]|uniref:Succinoglycan biosynthesis protein exoi n=2 Tax=Xaviernesmea oryzae TaxID=464029 RepID=A0A1Q9AW49_9HYPH|nr:succinoglycan biosynthesis protein exoi [Xaviernesmea oryzae]OLP59662.1 succinoglycan biosynthesis protein exoi [Xaviernesmea oryzae]SEM23690.1 hypothetical protein SAMN04487976_1246 [Xaviernesmea oryzae]